MSFWPTMASHGLASPPGTSAQSTPSATVPGSGVENQGGIPAEKSPLTTCSAPASWAWARVAAPGSATTAPAAPTASASSAATDLRTPVRREACIGHPSPSALAGDSTPGAAAMEALS
jgi:hypothetical protein